MLPKGTILYTIFATLGEVGILEIDASTNQAIAGLTIKDKNQILSEYLYYYLKSKKGYVKTIGRGVAQSNINMSILKSFQVPLPSSSKQNRIIDVLDKITNIIEYRQQELVELDDLIKARFVEMFGDCKELITLKDLCSIITDGTHQPPQFQDSGIPFILVSNLSQNTVTYDTKKYISEETYNELIKRTPIEVGDVLLSTVGSYGHPAVVTNDKKFLFQRHIAYLKPKRDIVNSFYLHGALLAPDAQRQIEEKVKGIAQKTLNLSEIKKIVIPIPSIECQNAFEQFVAQIDKSKHHSPHLPIPPLKWYPLPKNEVPIMEEKIIAITNEMAEVLNIAQLKKLQEVLVKAFTTEKPERKPTNHEYLRLFLEAKSIEGCSPRTLQYYEITK